LTPSFLQNREGRLKNEIPYQNGMRMEIDQDNESGDELGIAGLDVHGLVLEGSTRQPGTVTRNRKTATEAGSKAVGGRARQKGYPARQSAEPT
jgi:hypothetical protein